MNRSKESMCVQSLQHHHYEYIVVGKANSLQKDQFRPASCSPCQKRSFI